MSDAWFARPWALGLLAIVPALMLLWTLRRRWASRMLGQLGNPSALQRLLSVSSAGRRWQRLAILIGLSLLILGLAGPRYGEPRSVARASGPDLVFVLDLSRSMLAEQPSRVEKARRLVLSLADALERDGQVRVALIVFGAHPHRSFPLTRDLDHLRFALDALDPDLPVLRPRAGEELPSGTRIGAALTLALSAFEKPRPARQHLILLSDGDDPADDDEWLEGVNGAHVQGVPVHVVAVGDGRAAIPSGQESLRYQGKIVTSAVHEGRLQEIARRTRGHYFPPGSEALENELQKSWANLPPEIAEDGPLLQPPTSPGIFLALGFCSLALSMVVGDGRAWNMPRIAVGASLGVFALIATDGSDPAEAEVARAEAALRNQEYLEALVWYDKAARLTTDPGRVAFGRGGACFRLRRFHEAELYFRQATEDGGAPPDRRTRAFYDHGTTLLHLHDGKQREPLEQAVASFQACLRDTFDADLKKDAQYNLELAILKLRQQPPDPGQGNASRPPEKKAADLAEKKKGGSKSPGTNDAPAPKKAGTDTGQSASAKKSSASGRLQVLPDIDTLVPLSREETLAHLQRLRERIVREKKGTRIGSTGTAAKDW